MNEHYKTTILMINEDRGTANVDPGDVSTYEAAGYEKVGFVCWKS